MSLTTNAPISSGILPGGLTGNQLAAITRRGVAPVVFSQVYQSHPMLSLLLANAQPAMGGAPQISFPIQGSSFTSFQWGSFAGDFQLPQDQVAISNAQFNLKAGLVPIGFFGMEAIVQSSEVIVPKIRVVVSDAARVCKQALATGLYQNNANNNLAIDSLYQAYDNGNNVPTYGGISRSTQAAWQGQLYANSGSIMSRVGLATAIVRVQTGAGGEAPDMVVCNPVNWASLMADFMTLEMFRTTPTSVYSRDSVVNSGFSAINVLNVPVFADPFCPVGEMYMINSRYLAAFMHPALKFFCTDFESTVPLGQLAYIAVMVAALDVCCAKPSSGAHFTGISSTGWPGAPPPPPAVASQTAFAGEPLV